MSDNVLLDSNGNPMPEIKIKRANKKPEGLAPNPASYVKKMIAVVSGKGGVGKSLVTSLLAVNMNSHGFKTAVMDADVTGPSIAKAFGLSGRPTADEEGMHPLKSRDGVEVMSVNFLLENPSDPVIWRGPMISGAVGQFWTDVVWRDEDFLFIDMPPGTGDVPLTVFQSLPIDGVIIVSTPQDLVSMVVEKAVKMAQMMNIPILGFVENMSYTVCPKCGEKHYLFGESRIDAIAEKYGVKSVVKLPIDSRLAALIDEGRIEDFGENNLHAIVKMLRALIPPECGC
jgi:Mrp family chromosome partitioning ATPase